MKNFLPALRYFCASAFCAFLFWLAPAVAQDMSGKIQFRTLGAGVDAQDLYYTQDKKDVSVMVIPEARSIFYRCGETDKVVFYRMKTNPDGEIQRIPAAEADLAGKGTWPLLIFSKNPDASERYDVRVIEDDLASFPGGSFKYVNDTAQPVSASLGGENFQVPPRDMHLVRKNTGGPGALFSQVWRGKELIYSTNWAFVPLLRTMIFIRPSNEPGAKPVVFRVVESAEFPPEQPQGSSASTN